MQDNINTEQKRELTFKEKLTSLINSHSKENRSDTPDFILAEFMDRSLETFDIMTNKRDSWYEKDEEPSLENLLEGIDNGGQMFDENPFFRIIMIGILNGANPLKIISTLVQVIDEQQEEIMGLLKGNPTVIEVTVDNKDGLAMLMEIMDKK